MTGLLTHAKAFATRAHAGATRMGTGEPYINHVERVAALLDLAGLPEPVIAAGWLHDTIEDCGVTEAALAAEFGPVVARIVAEVTNPKAKGDARYSRAMRKGLARAHVGAGSAAAHSVKLADITDNMRDIVAVNPRFARTYVPEKRHMLAVLTKGEPGLRAVAEAAVAAAEKALAG